MKLQSKNLKHQGIKAWIHDSHPLLTASSFVMLFKGSKQDDVPNLSKVSYCNLRWLVSKAYMN